MGKPNFFIVGAAKSGTSSLDRYLSQHPEVFIPPKKKHTTSQFRIFRRHSADQATKV
ncbi:hypothetical protein GCM10025858_24250 [Alicyclobacillus sacchari]|nr:hypothetical protein GCM10025858_24250 [Alicyclobacillus sacchari]